MRNSDWSSDVCSSDLFFANLDHVLAAGAQALRFGHINDDVHTRQLRWQGAAFATARGSGAASVVVVGLSVLIGVVAQIRGGQRFGLIKEQSLTQMRSEEHTSELQSLMRIPSAVFC